MKYRIKETRVDLGIDYRARFNVEIKYKWWPFWVSDSYVRFYTLEEAKADIARSKAFQNKKIIFHTDNI